MNWWIDSDLWPGPSGELAKNLYIMDETYTRTIGVGGKQVYFKSLDNARVGDYVRVINDVEIIFEGYVHSWEGQLFADKPVEYDFVVTEQKPMPLPGRLP